MQIFNISHLFATPIPATVAVNTQNTKSRKRQRRRQARPIGCVNNASICTNGCEKHSSINPGSKDVTNNYEVSTNTTLHNPAGSKRKRRSKKSNSNNSGKLGANEVLLHPESATKQEDEKHAMMDLVNSLQTLTSEKNELEKNLNELREENDRLIRNNEDLKDELKEMTDEALELSVEKQRLLSKVGALKKQLLNRPK